MNELLLKSSRYLSSDSFAPLPLLRENPTPMIVNNSPNKIRQVPGRKSRITLQAYYDFTDIRSINLNNSLRPEKMIERSQEIRLAGNKTSRTSFVSSNSTLNQNSYYWTSFNSNGLSATKNRASIIAMPEIGPRPSRSKNPSRQGFVEQRNASTPVEPKYKLLSRTKTTMPKSFHRTITKSKSPMITSRVQPTQFLPKETNNILNNQMYESEEDDGNVPQVIDVEYQNYLSKAMTKCADWLIKYVFDQKYEHFEEDLI